MMIIVDLALLFLFPHLASVASSPFLGLFVSWVVRRFHLSFPHLNSPSHLLTLLPYLYC